MTAPPRGGGRGPMFALLPLLLVAAPLAAQDPRPPVRDTLRTPADSLRPPADSLPELDAAQDSARAAVIFPRMPLAPDVGAAGTQWVWNRERLLREADLSLIDMLERIPGVTTFRAGTLSQPEVASVFGATAGRVEIEIDGYVLDPLVASTYDLAQITLGQLREVRVQRRLGLLRIVLLTEFTETSQPYTRVEAGVGVPTANMFRGLFLVPHVIVGPIALGIERIDTDGINRSEPAGVFNGWVKWAWTNGVRGVQLEMVRSTLRREVASPWPGDQVRQDLVMRARNQFGRNFVAEIYGGRSTVEQTTPNGEGGDLRVDRESVQAGIRTALGLPGLAVAGAVRYRTNDDLPLLDAVIDAETKLGPLQLGGEVGYATWRDADAALYTTARAEAGRLLGAAVFGEITRGTRGVPQFDSTRVAEFAERNAWRAGVSFDLGRAAGSVAAVRLEQGLAMPFGLPFDSVGRATVAGPSDGLEAHGRLIIWPRYLTLSSWFTDWRSAPGRIYMPNRSWRTALELHVVPLASGNLEIYGRAEAHMRGSLQAYEPAPADSVGAFITVPGHTTADAYLQIRIIDVRIFVRWEDVLGADIQELPARVYRGPRILYGVKWNLWN